MFCVFQKYTRIFGFIDEKTVFFFFNLKNLHWGRDEWVDPVFVAELELQVLNILEQASDEKLN